MKLRNVFFFLSFNYVHCSHLFHTSFQVDSLHLSLTSFPWPRPFPRNISNTKECWSDPQTLACHEDLVPVRASESTTSVLPKGLYLPPTPVSATWGFPPFYLHLCVCVCIQHVRMCPQTPVQAAVNHPTRVLGTELGSLGRSRSTLSHLSNPSRRLFENCQRVLNFYPFPRIAGWKLRGTFILKFI